MLRPDAELLRCRLQSVQVRVRSVSVGSDGGRQMIDRRSARLTRLTFSPSAR